MAREFGAERTKCAGVPEFRRINPLCKVCGVCHTFFMANPSTSATHARALKQTEISTLIADAHHATIVEHVDLMDAYRIPVSLRPAVWYAANRAAADGMRIKQALSCVLTVLRLAAEDADVRAAINNAATALMLDRDEDNNGR